MFKFKKSKVMLAKLEELKYEDVLSMKKEDVASLIEETFETTVKDKAKSMDWRIEEDLPSHKEIVSTLREIDQNSHKAYKKLCKSLVRVNRKTTMRAINLFFHKLKAGIKVKVGAKEEEIQTKRKKWKELRDAAEKALAEYKEEKGDFYKKRLQ